MPKKLWDRNLWLSVVKRLVPRESLSHLHSAATPNSRGDSKALGTGASWSCRSDSEKQRMPELSHSLYDI